MLIVTIAHYLKNKKLCMKCLNYLPTSMFFQCVTFLTYALLDNDQANLAALFELLFMKMPKITTWSTLVIWADLGYIFRYFVSSFSLLYDQFNDHFLCYVMKNALVKGYFVDICLLLEKPK